MKYAWIFATIAAIVAGVWVWRGRDRGASRPAAPVSPGSAAAPAPGVDAGAIAIAVAPTPVAPPPVPGQVGTPPAPPPEAPPVAVSGADSVTFEREVRDPGWAVDQERELKVRMDHVRALLATRGAKLEVVAAECRATQCRIEVAAGAEGDLSALYGVLESPDGLYGWADAVVLGQIDRDAASGGLTTSVTAVFEREQ